jgi:predicted amidohydrolase
MLTYQPETFGSDLQSCKWIFDLFAIGFDHISCYFSPPASGIAFAEPTAQDILSLEDKLIASDGEIPKELWSALDLPVGKQELTGQSFLMRLFFVLQVIDRACADLNYFKYGLDATRWERVTQRLYLNDANLAMACDGLVTIMPPRLGRPHPEAWSTRALEKGWKIPVERGIHHHRYFQNLSRVPPIPGCNVRHFVLSARTDLDSRAWPVLKIGMVPMLHELELCVPTHAQYRPGPLRILPTGQGRFSIGTEPTGSKSWQEVFDLVDKAFAFFITNNVQLVVFPELTVPDPVLDHMKNILRHQAMTQGKGIELVLAGTFLRDEGENGLPKNTAVVLNGSGQELWRQRKMQPYEMQPYEQERYGLQGLFGNCARREDIECFPREIFVCDSPSAGLRIAVLICEDCCHQQPAISAVQQLRANLLLVPVMAGALLPERQFSSSATALAYEPGAITVISNSAVFPSCEWAGHPPGAASGDPPIGIVSMPLQDTTYESKWFINKYIKESNIGRIVLFSVGE